MSEDWKPGNNRKIPLSRPGTVEERAETISMSQELLRLFARQAPAAIALFDQDMRFLAATERWESEFGLTGLSFIGQHLYDLFPGLHDQWKTFHSSALEGNGSQCGEGECIKLNGDRCWIRWEMRPWRTDSGTVGGAIALVEDITAKYKAEQARQFSEQLQRQTLNALPAHIAVLDSEARIIATNQSWEKFATENSPTYKRPITLGANYLEVCRRAAVESDASADQALKGIEAVLAGRHKEFTMEYPCHSPTEQRWFEMTVVPLAAAGGAVVTHVDITESMQTANALREKELHLKLWLEASPSGALMVDDQGTITMVNSALATLSGYSAAELVGKSLEILVPDELRGRHEILRAEYTKSPVARRMGAAPNLPLRRKDGTIVQVEIALSPRAVWGDGIQVTAIINDMTDRIAAEQALRESERSLRASEQRFRDLTDQVADGIFSIDSEGHCLDANRAGCEMFGYTLDELKARTLVDLLVGDAFRSLPEKFQHLEANDTVRSEWRFRRKDGSTFVGELDSRQLSDGRILAAVRDVTERNLAQERLMDSEERLRLAVKSGNVGLWDWNLVSNKVRRSPEWKNQIGYQDDEIDDGFDAWSVRLHPEDRDRVVRGAWDQVANPQGQYTVEYRILHKDGNYRTIYSIGDVHRDKDGVPVRMLGCDIDITERKKAEDALREEDERKNEFLAFLGHELRNPLAAISTAVHVLSTGVTVERRDELIHLIGRQTMVLRRLVDELLELSRITFGKIELKKELVDLSDLLQLVSTVARPSFASREQELLVRLPPGYVRFMADEVRLEQIVTNLLINASKYTQKGGKVELWGSREGSEVVIRCKDNGLGIPAGSIHKIFEPFMRQPAAEFGYGEPSLGVGLALVQRLVKLHGGIISVQSAGLGTGSEFTVRLPLVEPSDALRETVAPPQPTAQRAFQIVLVEDNVDVAQATASALEAAGHRVAVFFDGPSALSGLTGAWPDAILVDIGLPGMDGYELATKLRQQENLRGAVLVALSGHARRASTEQAGFDEYFVKPMVIEELLQFLEKRLGAKQQGTGESGPATQLRVLLVEDNAELAEVTAEMLRHENLNVRVVHSGQEALEIAPNLNPDLTICDWNLPDMSGKDVASALRSSSATHHTYTVILTAKRRADISALRSRADEMGIDEIIPKPLLPDTLREMLARLQILRARRNWLSNAQGA